MRDKKSIFSYFKNPELERKLIQQKLAISPSVDFQEKSDPEFERIINKFPGIENSARLHYCEVFSKLIAEVPKDPVKRKAWLKLFEQEIINHLKEQDIGTKIEKSLLDGEYPEVTRNFVSVLVKKINASNDSQESKSRYLGELQKFLDGAYSQGIPSSALENSLRIPLAINEEMPKYKSFSVFSRYADEVDQFNFATAYLHTKKALQPKFYRVTDETQFNNVRLKNRNCFILKEDNELWHISSDGQLVQIKTDYFKNKNIEWIDRKEGEAFCAKRQQGNVLQYEAIGPLSTMGFEYHFSEKELRDILENEYPEDHNLQAASELMQKAIKGRTLFDAIQAIHSMPVLSYLKANIPMVGSKDKNYYERILPAFEKRKSTFTGSSLKERIAALKIAERFTQGELLMNDEQLRPKGCAYLVVDNMPSEAQLKQLRKNTYIVVKLQEKVYFVDTFDNHSKTELKIQDLKTFWNEKLKYFKPGDLSTEQAREITKAAEHVGLKTTIYDRYLEKYAYNEAANRLAETITLRRCLADLQRRLPDLYSQEIENFKKAISDADSRMRKNFVWVTDKSQLTKDQAKTTYLYFDPVARKLMAYKFHSKKGYQSKEIPLDTINQALDLNLQLPDPVAIQAKILMAHYKTVELNVGESEALKKWQENPVGNSPLKVEKNTLYRYLVDGKYECFLIDPKGELRASSISEDKYKDPNQLIAVFKWLVENKMVLAPKLLEPCFLDRCEKAQEKLALIGNRIIDYSRLPENVLSAEKRIELVNNMTSRAIDPDSQEMKNYFYEGEYACYVGSRESGRCNKPCFIVVENKTLTYIDMQGKATDYPDIAAIRTSGSSFSPSGGLINLIRKSDQPLLLSAQQVYELITSQGGPRMHTAQELIIEAKENTLNWKKIKEAAVLSFSIGLMFAASSFFTFGATGIIGALMMVSQLIMVAAMAAYALDSWWLGIMQNPWMRPELGEFEKELQEINQLENGILKAHEFDLTANMSEEQPLSVAEESEDDPFTTSLH